MRIKVLVPGAGFEGSSRGAAQCPSLRNDHLRSREFTARVSSRSSKTPGVGPPGEREILRLNPQRAELLQRATGWRQLEGGSLNLEADEQVLSAMLDSRAPAVFVPPGTVIYPPPYDHIPGIRNGYRYFRVTAHHGAKQCPVLLRRAVNPLPGRVQLFTDVHLRTVLGVEDGDQVIVVLEEIDRGAS